MSEPIQIHFNSKPIPFRHEWTISGLSSVSDRITRHPYIRSIFYKTFEIHFYPRGYDESCREYVSFDIYRPYNLKFYISFKISIKNTQKEKVFIKEWTLEINDNKVIKEYIQRDFLLAPANGLTQNDQFTLFFEGCVYWKNIIPTNLQNNAELSRDYFKFSPLLSTKSLALKWIIENVINLFEMTNKSSIELPHFKDETESGKAVFNFQIQIIKNSYSNNKKLLFELKSNNKGLFVIETSVIDNNQQKCHGQKKTFENGFIHNFIVDKKIYLSQSVLADNRLTLFCEISSLTETIKDENRYNFLQMIECVEETSTLQINECTIDGTTGKIIENKVVPLFSNIDDKEIQIEKLEQLSNSIVEQTKTIDHATIIMNNIYHEHYFENSNIKDSLVNTKSKSIFGDISLKSGQTDCTELIEKLEDVVSNAIKPVLDQNEQKYTEMKSSTDYLLAKVLDNNKLLLENHQEMRKEMNALQSELSKMKQTKKVKQSKMKQIVDRIIALLNRIKYYLNRVGTNITRVRKSKSTTPKSHEPTNRAIEYIEPHTSSLIKYVQSVPTSQTISDKTKQNHIHKLETVKHFLISNLPAESCSVGEHMTTNLQNLHLEIDSITKENAELKLADMIDNHTSDWDKKLFTKLRELIVELKSESIKFLSDGIQEDTENSE